MLRAPVALEKQFTGTTSAPPREALGATPSQKDVDEQLAATGTSIAYSGGAGNSWAWRNRISCRPIRGKMQRSGGFSFRGVASANDAGSRFVQAEENASVLRRYPALKQP